MKEIAPRDEAGQFKFPATTDAPVKHMIGLGARLLAISALETFEVRTPDSVDPERKYPDAPWVNTKVRDVGTASPIVARTFMTAHQFLHGNWEKGSRQEAVLECVYGLMEGLLHCQAVVDELREDCKRLEAIVVESNSDGKRTRAVINFPVVDRLNARCLDFLIHARGALTQQSQMVGLFVTLKRHHSDIRYLVKNELSADAKLEPLASYLASWFDFADRIVDLRNGLEHAATTAKKTYVHNYVQRGDKSIVAPQWQLHGGQEEFILSEMQYTVDSLVQMAESLFLYCFDVTKPAFPPIVIVGVEKPEADCPVRYRPHFDISALPMVSSPVPPEA